MKAPFPWFGGKSRVAHLVWERFGDVPNYVEPFAGSLAVLLNRPTNPRIETVNDLDCFLSNFWRAIQFDPQAVADHADWPVNEADLHARHLWLVNQTDFRERMKSDPDYFDPKIAGWWVWGICQWIGSGWCSKPEWAGRGNASRAARGIATVDVKRPQLKAGGSGVFSTWQARPCMRSQGVNRQLPDLSGDSGAAGRGVHASARSNALTDWFADLQNRLRKVRVCCGDWKRVLGPSPTTKIGITGVFLDPPYSQAERSKKIYSEDSPSIATEVRDWAIENGENPQLRIALCGYEGEHVMPDSWKCIAWKAAGGYGNQGDGLGRANAGRERIWFSQHCLSASLFERGLNELIL